MGSCCQVRVTIVEKFEEKMAVVKEGANNIMEEIDKGVDHLREGMEKYSTKRKTSEGFSVMEGLNVINGTPVKIASGEKTEQKLVSPLGNEDLNDIEDNLEKGAMENELDMPTVETPRESFAYIDTSIEGEEGLRIITGKEHFNLSEAEKAKSESSYIASMEDLRAVPELDKMDTKMRLRMKKTLYVADLSMKLTDPTRSKSVYQKSNLYLGILFIISIFYSLPVLQMVFRFPTIISTNLNLPNKPGFLQSRE